MPRYKDVPSYASLEAFQLCITQSLMDASASIYTGLLLFGLVLGASLTMFHSLSPCFTFFPNLGMPEQEGWDTNNYDRSCG